MDEIARAMSPDAFHAVCAPEAVARLVETMGLPHRLREVGLAREVLPRIGMLTREHFPDHCAEIDALGPNVFDTLIEELW